MDAFENRGRRCSAPVCQRETERERQRETERERCRHGGVSVSTSEQRATLGGTRAPPRQNRQVECGGERAGVREEDVSLFGQINKETAEEGLTE